MTLANPSAVPAVYSWGFAPGAMLGKKELGVGEIGQYFDLLPIRGTLAAGAVETVELTYKGSIAGKLSATALCHVVGGPVCEFPLTAESSDMKYRYSCVGKWCAGTTSRA